MLSIVISCWYNGVYFVEKIFSRRWRVWSTIVMRPNWFIGIPVPARLWLKRALINAPEGFRCFHPDDLHIIVSFLGPVEFEEDLALYTWSDNRAENQFKKVFAQTIDVDR